MTSTSGSQSLILCHEPYGEMHPYIPLPYERFPRDPIAGEPVELNIETGHTPSANRVWCIWRVDGDAEEHKTEAGSPTVAETVDHWKVELPPFKRFEVVHYRLFAWNDGRASGKSGIYFFGCILGRSCLYCGDRGKRAGIKNKAGYNI